MQANRKQRGYRGGLLPRQDMYNKKDTRIEYQLFSQEYFSGADMHIYFGDIWIDDITSLEFTLQEEVLPIYGYNSYTFDALARGRRQIVGSFTLNFTSVGYLQNVLKHADAINHTIAAGAAAHKINIKHFEKYRLDEILKLYGKDSFEQIADEYEEAIWGATKATEDNTLSYANAPYFQRDSPDGFDIRVNYGAVQETFQNSSFYNNSFQQQPNLTVEVINGVHITGVQKRAATADQGAPIQEIYTFIAQDLNATSHSV